MAYAASRFIEVVPEIELPGHCCSALASYPYLGCEHASSPRTSLLSWQQNCSSMPGVGTLACMHVLQQGLVTNNIHLCKKAGQVRQ